MRLLLVGLALGLLACSPQMNAGGPTAGLHRLTGSGDHPVRLMVQEGAFRLQEKAADERDSRTLAWVWRTYEWLEVPPQTAVRILQTDLRGAQVEIAEGPYAGRRGWISTDEL